MDRLTPPEALDIDGTNLADSSKIQSATLLHLIGPAALEVYILLPGRMTKTNRKSMQLWQRLQRIVSREQMSLGKDTIFH